MRIKQLGNGGGLDVNQTNSSFLIEFGDELLLIDCGFNVPQKLFDLHKSGKIDITKIKTVFISHGHTDHIGGLETLIFKLYFEYGVVLKCYLPEEKYYLDFLKINNIYENSVIKDKTICEPIHYNSSIYTLNNQGGRFFLRVKPFENNHKVCKSFGFRITSVISYSSEQQTYIISGDTKAFTELEEISEGADLVFHDFSNWDCQSKNVHACASDIRETYSEEFQKKIIYYHNSGNFISSWRE